MKTHNNYFTIMMLLISLLLAHATANANGPVELMCKNKAKEIALQTYQNCVTEEKTTRLKALKERYKSRMSEVKDEFQRELDEINGAQNRDEQIMLKPTSEPTANPVSVHKPKTKSSQRRSAPRAEKPVQGIAKSLPTKQNNAGPALPIQAVNNTDESVVVSQSAIAEPSLQESTPEPEIIEIAE